MTNDAMTKECPKPNDQISGSPLAVVIGHWAFIGHWSLVIGHWSLVTAPCAFYLVSAATRLYVTLDIMEEPKQPSERKTIDDRQRMSELERIRHSCAHVMATAIAKLWPDAQFAAGPPVENGFYYDVDLQHRISPEDFPKIEEEMKKEIKANHPFEKIIVNREQAW